MKKIIISAACLAIALASCNQIETLENEYQAMSLGINVTTAVETKGLVRGTKLPDGSSIGIFVTDKSGVTYDGQTFENVKYTASGSESSQTWSSETSIMLSNNQAVLASYYPYSEDVTDVKAIPVKATSDIQTDWMWSQPVTGLYNKNTTATITMKHALTAVRLSVQKGKYEGSVEVTSVGFSSEGAATEALLDATNGTLSSISGQGTQFVVNETFVPSSTKKSFDIITVPAGVSAPMVVELTVNGSKMTALGKSVLLEAGNIYEYTISVDGTNGASINAVGVEPWQSYGYAQGSVAFYEELEYNFDGTIPEPFVEWAAIQHKDGSLYSASKWLAYETAGLVTDDDANGVVVLYSRYAVCPHVIHRRSSTSYLSYLNPTQTALIPGVTVAATSAEAQLDVNGRANTEALLAAVADGTITTAPTAQYCAGITFPNGQQGYLPAAGEVQAWMDNETEINKCLEAVGSDKVLNGSKETSTLKDRYYRYRTNGKSFLTEFNTTQGGYARPVTEFTPPM